MFLNSSSILSVDIYFTLTPSLHTAHQHLLCSGSRDNSVRVWDMPTRRYVAVMEIPRNLVCVCVCVCSVYVCVCVCVKPRMPSDGITRHTPTWCRCRGLASLSGVILHLDRRSLVGFTMSVHMLLLEFQCVLWGPLPANQVCTDSMTAYLAAVCPSLIERPRDPQG